MESIVMKGLTKEYDTASGPVAAVRDLSLAIPSGNVFGFLGPNGSGKTTTMKMLVGLARPTKGEISILGGSPSDIEVRKQFGFMPESPAFYLYLTGREFLKLIADIFDLAEKERRISEVLDEVELSHSADRQIRTYSKGMLQRLGLAQALLNDPKVLFLDEPLDGLDPLGRSDIKRIFLRMKEKRITIFFNSHILADVSEICDLVGIIDQGSLVAFDTPSRLTKGSSDLETAFVDMIRKKRANRT